jgi:cysteine desulfurase
MFHTDAVQAVGKIPIDLKNTKIDMLSLSGHKLHAPKGIGVLYLRRGCRFRPLLRGGHQERGRRAGTENSASIVALGMACELAMRAHGRGKHHRSAPARQAGKRHPQPDRPLLPDRRRQQPPAQYQQYRFEYIEGEAILLLLNKLGIAGSSGSACTSGSLEPSHVMRAMGIPYTAAHGTIRFSLSRYNTEAEIDRVIAVVRPSSPNCASFRRTGPTTARRTNPEAAFAPTYA